MKDERLVVLSVTFTSSLTQYGMNLCSLADCRDISVGVAFNLLENITGAGLGAGAGAARGRGIGDMGAAHSGWYT